MLESLDNIDVDGISEVADELCERLMRVETCAPFEDLEDETLVESSSDESSRGLALRP